MQCTECSFFVDFFSPPKQLQSKRQGQGAHDSPCRETKQRDIHVGYLTPSPYFSIMGWIELHFVPQFGGGYCYMLGHSAVVEVSFTHDHDPSLNSLAFSLPMKPPRSYAYVWNRIGSRTPSMANRGGDGENRAHTHTHTKENAYMQSHDTQQQRFIMQPELQDIRSPASSNWFLRCNNNTGTGRHQRSSPHPFAPHRESAISSGHRLRT